MSYDKQCLALAESFMADHPGLEKQKARTAALAQVIQDAIDDEMTDYAEQDHEAEARIQRAAYDAEKAAEPDPTDPRSQAYAERMYEAADMERKRLREEGR